MDRLTETSSTLTERSIAAPGFRPSAPGKGRTFALLHIPKCSGTSLMRGIERGIGPGRHVNGFDRCLFGNFGQFERIPRLMRNVIYLDKSKMPPDAATVMGHFSYDTLRSGYPQADLAVFLREPTVRLLSHWVHWRSLTWSSLRHWGTEWSAWLKLGRLPLQTFLSHPAAACQTDNLAVRMLVWPHRLIPDDGFIDPEHDQAVLAIALKNLENFGFTGITERGTAAYREFGEWLGIRLDLPSLNLARKMRRSARTQLGRELNTATLDLLRERTRLDARLWEHLATLKMDEAEADKLRQNAVLQAAARFSALLA